MYFETSSYSTSSIGETFESAWPKTNNESPYTLAATDSSQAITWYNLNRVSSSAYDKDNQNRLVNLLPKHIKEDSQNEVFNKFMDMIGQHFDEVYSYVRGLTDIHLRDEGLTNGISKDLIYDVAKNNKFVTPCTAGDLSYVIWEDGRVNACEILPDVIGNVNTTNIQKDLFSSNKAKELRKKIKDTKCKCTYECAMSTNTFFSWNMTKKMISAYISNRI